MQEYYCDYEALEFNNRAAVKRKVYPYYLKPDLSETSLCPLFFSAATPKGKIANKQNVLNQRISFLDFLDNELKHNTDDRKEIKIWFHNVQYDFRIILHEIVHAGFTNVLDNEKIEYSIDTTFHRQLIDEGKPCYSIVGQNLSSYVGINMYYKGFKIIIRDTYKIISQAQDVILKDFGFESKVKVDWNKINIYNLESYMPLIEERNIYDVVSLAKCFSEFKSTFYNEFHGKGSTAAGMSLDALKYYLAKQAGFTEINRDAKDTYFRELYPVLDKDIAWLSRISYHGGICTVNPDYAGKILYNLQMVDINSSYPYALTFPLPYGLPEKLTNFTDEGYSEYIVYIRYKSKGVPFQRCHSENNARRFLGLEPLPKEQTYTRSQFLGEFEGYLAINSVDLNTLKKHSKIYTLEFKYGVNYKTNTVIRDFIIPLYEKRKISKGMMKQAIKLLLNSLYGKYAQDLSGTVFLYETIDDYEKVDAIDTDTIFKPLASCTTARARENWVDTCYIIGKENFVYGDTDSHYFINIQEVHSRLTDANRIHDSELGKWAYDKGYGRVIHKGKFLGKKNYIISITPPCSRRPCKKVGMRKMSYIKHRPNHIKDRRHIKVTCVGLSHRYHRQVTFTNFVINSIPFKVQKMKNIYGGKAMRDTDFIIRERFYR